MSEYMRGVVSDIEDRRREQNHMWGDVDGPDRAMPFGTSDDVVRRKIRDSAQDYTKRMTEAGTLSWRDILVEEVFELLAEDPSPENWPALRDEIIDAAAVLVAMAEAGDLRAATQETQTEQGRDRESASAST